MELIKKTFLISLLFVNIVSTVFGQEDTNNIKMPNFYADITNSTGTTVSFSLSYDRIFSNASFYEIVVLKLNKDINGIPRLSKTDSAIWKDFNSFTAEPAAEEPYIAARYSAALLPTQITIGDGKHNGGFFNGPLQPDNYYVIFLRGTVLDGTTTSHLPSEYLSDIHKYNEVEKIPEFFHTHPITNRAIIKFSILLIVGATLTTALFIGFVCKGGVYGKVRRRVFRKRRNSPKYIEFESTPSKTKIKRKRRTTSRQDTAGARHEKKSKKRVPSQSHKRRTKPSKVVRNKKRLSTISEADDYVPAEVGQQNNVDLTPLITVTTPCTETLPVPTIQLTPQPSTASTPTNMDTPGTPTALADLPVQTHSLQKDTNLSSVTLQTQGNEARSLKQRMTAYRWLIALKKSGKLPPGVDIKRVFEGTLDLPEAVLRVKPASVRLQLD